MACLQPLEGHHHFCQVLVLQRRLLVEQSSWWHENFSQKLPQKDVFFIDFAQVANAYVKVVRELAAFIGICPPEEALRKVPNRPLG